MEEVFDTLGISDEMIENINDGYWPSYSDELKGFAFGRYVADNSIAGIEFYRNDNTSISLEFSLDNRTLEAICFWDYSDHSEEVKEFEMQINRGTEAAVDWDSGKVLSVGDVVKFGHYEQDGVNDNGPEDILWYVVAVDNNECFLVSCMGLDIVEYDVSEEGKLNWSNSHIRKWLQDEFYPKAFEDAEKSVILTKKLDVIDEFGWSSDASVAEVTEDKVFLLSSKEVDTYLDETQRLMLVSEYVKNIANTHNITTCGYYIRACYSADTKLGWGIGEDGELRPYDYDGPFDYSPPVSVRPAIWIKQ